MSPILGRVIDFSVGGSNSAMSVRTHKRLAALVIALSLCIAAYPAHSQALYSEPANSASTNDGRSGLSTCGDPDRGNGSPPPSGTISKTSAGTGVVVVSGNKGMALKEWLTRWMTGLLQRIGYGY
jgi:hypothetical protein